MKRTLDLRVLATLLPLSAFLLVGCAVGAAGDEVTGETHAEVSGAEGHAVGDHTPIRSGAPASGAAVLPPNGVVLSPTGVLSPEPQPWVTQATSTPGTATSGTTPGGTSNKSKADPTPASDEAEDPGATE